MGIRSKKAGQTPASEAPSEVVETTDSASAPKEDATVTKAEVQAAAKLSNAEPEQLKYELVTPYPIVTPGGVRFLPNEPQLHPRTNWMDSNVQAKIFRVIKQK